VLGAVARDRIDRVVFAAVVVVVGFGESVLLPFDFTQRVSLANWRYFNGRDAAFTVAFALAMAWVVTLQVHAMRTVAGAARAPGAPRPAGVLGVLAAVVSLLPSFLCCSPIVPTAVGLLGLSASTQLRTTGRIQHFFATRQDLLLLASLALVVGSGLWSMRTLARASCLAGECCVADEAAGGTAGDAAAPPGPSSAPVGGQTADDAMRTAGDPREVRT